MGLVTCADCGNSISDRAPACPKCGAPLVLAQVELYLGGLDRTLLGKNDFVITISYNGEERHVLRQGERARLAFPSGGQFDFTFDVPGMAFKRKTQTLSYEFPDGFKGNMKFAIEGSMPPQLVALKIED